MGIIDLVIPIISVNFNKWKLSRLYIKGFPGKASKGEDVKL